MSYFEDWKNFACTDWSELQRYVLREYGSEAWTAVQNQFAKRMNISQNVLDQLSAFAVGKVQDKALGAFSTMLSIADCFAKIAGFIYIASANQCVGRVRANPHFLLIQGIFSSAWTLDESQVEPYVDFMLYWYPKDRDAGFRGFRYGRPTDTAPLPKR